MYEHGQTGSVGAQRCTTVVNSDESREGVSTALQVRVPHCDSCGQNVTFACPEPSTHAERALRSLAASQEEKLDIILPGKSS